MKKVMKRGLALLLLVVFLSGQILPELNISGTAVVYASQIEESSSAAETEKAETPITETEKEETIAAETEREETAAETEREETAAETEREETAAETGREETAAETEREETAAETEREETTAAETEREETPAETEKEETAAETEEEEASATEAEKEETPAAETEKEEAPEQEQKPEVPEQSPEQSKKLDTAELDKLMEENKTEPVAPKKEVAEDQQNKSTIAGETTSTTAKAAFGELRSFVEKTLAEQGKDLLKESTRLEQKGNRKLAEAAEVSAGKAKRLIRKGNNCLDRADELAESASKYKAGANIMKWAGVAMDGYSIYTNVKEMDNLKNERSFFLALESTALAADTVLSVVSIAAAVTGAFSPPGLALTLAVGLASAVLHSDEFANWANNVDSGFLDAVDKFFEELLPWMKTPDDVGCYKPNIYIYSKSEREVEIRFKFPILLTVTIPDYSSGWEVTTGENGSLTDEDGQEYSYLFYESITSKGLFQTEEGFEIPAEQRAEYFEAILTQMGFNQQEIADFIEFWNVKLDAGMDYIMYPQDTETVDIAMPLEISDMPESIERIWFVFEADEGQQVAEPEIEVIDRSEDYALVEWGGMIFD